MLSGPDTVVLLVIALLVFGPKKLPEMGKSLGRTIHDLRDAMEGRLPPEDTSPRRDDDVAVRRVEHPAPAPAEKVQEPQKPAAG